MSSARRPEPLLPFAGEPSTHLLPWIVGIMVYLAVMMLAGAMVLADIAAEWDYDLTGSFTVLVASPEGGSGTAHEMQVEAAIRILRDTAGVATVRAVSTEATAASLAPWLGPDIDLREFPLPRVIDVTLVPSADVNFDALAQQLRKAVPGAELDSHEFWRDQMMTFVGALEALVLLVIILITASTMAAVMFATRSGVAIHREVIEVLHIIGATDDHIAQEFKRQARRLALLGSFPGLLLALASLAIVGQLGGRVDSLLLPVAPFSWWQWTALAAVPIFTTVIAAVTARRTVLRALRRML